MGPQQLARLLHNSIVGLQQLENLQYCQISTYHISYQHSKQCNEEEVRQREVTMMALKETITQTFKLKVQVEQDEGTNTKQLM